MSGEVQPQRQIIQGNVEIINPSSDNWYKDSLVPKDTADQQLTSPVTPNVSEEYKLIVSHNNRIQSWLDPLLKTEKYFKEIFETKGKMRFLNCAAFSLEFKKNMVSIILVYPGDDSGDAKTKTGWFGKETPVYYWGTENNESKYIVKFQNFDIFLEDFLSILKIKNKESKKIDEKLIDNLIGQKFLIVRHGEATHNLKDRNSFDYDTFLTSKGIEQGKKLGKHLKTLGYQINRDCYVSDLIRTGMTAWAIGTEFFDKDSFNKYVVVPCNTEVSNAKGDKGNLSKRPGYQNENKTRCKPNERCIRSFQGVDLTNNYDFKYYNSFFSTQGFLSSQKKCTDDFFQQLNIVLSNKLDINPVSTATEGENTPAAAGGSKYKRTKKLKKGKKFTKKGGKKNKARKTSKK